MSRRNATFWSKVGETGVGETGVGETGVGETGVGEQGISPFSVFVLKLYGFCLSIAYIACRCHPYIESLPTL